MGQVEQLGHERPIGGQRGRCHLGDHVPAHHDDLGAGGPRRQHVGRDRGGVDASIDEPGVAGEPRVRRLRVRQVRHAHTVHLERLERAWPTRRGCGRCRRATGRRRRVRRGWRRPRPSPRSHEWFEAVLQRSKPMRRRSPASSYGAAISVYPPIDGAAAEPEPVTGPGDRRLHVADREVGGGDDRLHRRQAVARDPSARRVARAAAAATLTLLSDSQSPTATSENVRGGGSARTAGAATVAPSSHAAAVATPAPASATATTAPTMRTCPATAGSVGPASPGRVTPRGDGLGRPSPRDVRRDRGAGHEGSDPTTDRRIRGSSPPGRR